MEDCAGDWCVETNRCISCGYHLVFLPVVDIHGGAAVQVSIFRVSVDTLERLEYGVPRGEDAVRKQECIEEVDREEPQIREPV